MARRRKSDDQAAALGCLFVLGLAAIGLAVMYWYITVPILAIAAWYPLAQWLQRRENQRTAAEVQRIQELDQWAAEISANPMADVERELRKRGQADAQHGRGPAQSARKPAAAQSPHKPRKVADSPIRPETLRRIRARHEQGATLTAIANELNADGVPTARGGARWWPSTVRTTLEKAKASR